MRTPSSTVWMKTMLVMALITLAFAQPQPVPSGALPQQQQASATVSSPAVGTPAAPTVTNGSAVTPAATVTITATTATEIIDAPAPTQTPGPAPTISPLDANNCFTFPNCAPDQDCFVVSNGLVCLKKDLYWGYVLSRNNSGIPSVPGWSGPRSQLDDDCTLFRMPDSADRPGLAIMVYDLIHDTLPQDLLLSRYDQATTNWYTFFSNCEPHLACLKGKCQPRPTLGQSCTSSWQCNAQALGLNENNAPISSANVSEVRCEYEGGDKSTNTTCQLIRRETKGSGSGFLAWHVIVPLVVLAIIGYFAWVIYRRYKNEQKHGKWKRVAEDKEENRNNYPLEAYDDLR
ncbi:hypothetical protein BGX24_011887 [Mortierella sp. AD032]|nr:hypothetical protein BGX24_011887 [Mortierella sp. AD032]